MTRPRDRRTPRIIPSGPVRLRLPGHWLWWAGGAAVLVAVLVPVVLGVLIDSGEELLVRKARERLAARLDAEVDIGSARSGMGWAELRGVTIRGPGGARIEADEVRVPLDLAGVTNGGGAPFTEVRLRGVEIVLDPHAEETRAWLRRLLGHGSGGRSGGGPEEAGGGAFFDLDLSTVDLEIADLAVHLVDAAGTPRELLSRGAFRIDRSVGRGAEVAGEAGIAGSGRLTIDGVDGPDGSRLGLRITDLDTRWVRPLLPEGVALRSEDETRFAGRIDLGRATPQAPWTGSGRLEAGGVTLASDRLADAPVLLPPVVLEVDGLGVTPAGSDGARRIALRDGRLSVGPEVTAALEVVVETGPNAPRVRVEAAVPRTPCRALVETVPETLLRDLDRIELDGSWSAEGLLDLPWNDLDATRLELGFDDGCRFRGMPDRVRARTLRQPFTLRVPAAEEGRFLEHTTGPGAPSWVPLARVSRYVEQAVLAHEDAAFYEHDGFAPWAIRNSLVENLEAGRFVRGASTVSMQLAKNLYLTRDKVLARKVREVLLTWWLERTLTKEEILALYLNVIEYGPDLYGIGAAARHYFDAPPARLGPAEAAFLATILPNPRAYHRNHERGSLSDTTRSQMRFLLEHMHRKERIDQAELEWGLEGLEEFRFGRVHPRPGSSGFRWRLLGSADPGGEEEPPGATSSSRRR